MQEATIVEELHVELRNVLCSRWVLLVLIEGAEVQIGLCFDLLSDTYQSMRQMRVRRI